MKQKPLLTMLIAAVLLAGSLVANAENSTSPKHYIELSVSDGSPLLNDQLRVGDCSPLRAYTQYELWDSGKYTGRRGGIFPINLGYYYQVLPWLQVGGEFSVFTPYIMNLYDIVSNEKVTNYTNVAMHFTVGARFTYFQTDFVQLYSGLTLGLRMSVESRESTIPYTSFAPAIDNYGVAFQATAFGVRFGKQVYGFAELGCGYKGIFNLGIGTRF